jgi:hypothetical protein
MPDFPGELRFIAESLDFLPVDGNFRLEKLEAIFSLRQKMEEESSAP